MKTLGYLRVSHLESLNGTSLETQEKRIKNSRRPNGTKDLGELFLIYSTKGSQMGQKISEAKWDKRPRRTTLNLLDRGRPCGNGSAAARRKATHRGPLLNQRVRTSKGDLKDHPSRGIIKNSQPS